MYEVKSKHRLDLKAEIKFLTEIFPAVTKPARRPYDISAEMKYVEKLYPRRYTPSTETTPSSTSKSSISTNRRLPYPDSSQNITFPILSIPPSSSSSMRTPVQTKSITPPSTEPRYNPSSKQSMHKPILKRRKARVNCFKQTNS